MKTFTVLFKEKDGYDEDHQDKGRVLEDGTVEVWCPWDGRWIPFQSLELLQSIPPYGAQYAELMWDEADE